MNSRRNLARRIYKRVIFFFQKTYIFPKNLCQGSAVLIVFIRVNNRNPTTEPGVVQKPLSSEKEQATLNLIHHNPPSSKPKLHPTTLPHWESQSLIYQTGLKSTRSRCRAMIETFAYKFELYIYVCYTVRNGEFITQKVICKLTID